MDVLSRGEIFILLIIAISVGGGIIKRYMSLLAQRMDQRITSQDRTTASEIAAMRQELAQLRDTSTQFDMSLQRTLEEVQQRLTHLESKRSDSQSGTIMDRTEQRTVNLRGS